MAVSACFDECKGSSSKSDDMKATDCNEVLSNFKDVSSTHFNSSTSVKPLVEENVVDNSVNTTNEDSDVKSTSPSKVVSSPSSYSIYDCKLHRFRLGQLTKHNVGQVKQINLKCLPILYPDSFYAKLPAYHEFSRLAYIGDLMVAAICCRSEMIAEKEYSIYILTLAVLEPYRRYGIGSTLLKYILAKASQSKENKEIYLHVWVGNDFAIKFYEGFGFEISEKFLDYYSGIDPPDGFVLSLQLPWIDSVTGMDFSSPHAAELYGFNNKHDSANYTTFLSP